MAKETITKLIDDLDGSEAHETVKFGLDGKTYEIDLSSKNAGKLRGALAAYTNHATRVTNATTRQVAAAAAEKEERGRIREWALSKGYDVGVRGRIKQEIIDAYHARRGR